MTRRHSGKVKWFKPEKGYGFIIPDEGGGDVFLISKKKSYVEGQSVTFRMKSTESGNVRALYVKVVQP